MGKFIALEGLHAVGKSTIARLLAHRIGAKPVPTVPDEFNDVRRFLNSQGSADARFCLFLSALFIQAQEIQKILATGVDVVVESYFYRAISFHKGMGALLEIRLPKNIPWPDHIFHLVCDEGVRQDRKIERGKKEGAWDLLAETNHRLILEEYRKFSMTEIDVSSINPREVVDKIERSLKDKT